LLRRWSSRVDPAADDQDRADRQLARPPGDVRLVDRLTHELGQVGGSQLGS
jgi:hypothetical protein